MKFKEWPPGVGLMRKVDDAGLVIEGCYSNGVDSALLYAENLTEKFFDLSSGEAGGDSAEAAELQDPHRGCVRSRECTIQQQVWRDGVRRGARRIFSAVRIGSGGSEMVEQGSVSGGLKGLQAHEIHPRCPTSCSKKCITRGKSG